MTSDQLQNEILTISHHLQDVTKALGHLEQSIGHSTDLAMVTSGLSDIAESVKRLNGLLPAPLEGEMDRMAEQLEPGEIAYLMEDDQEEYPCPDKDHTQSAIGYIMKYQHRAGAIGAKAKRNKKKVAAAARHFGIELPQDW